VIKPAQQRGASAAAGAPATKVFIALSVIFYLATSFGTFGDQIFNALAQDNQAVTAGEWWRIFTVVLLHGSITHILFNMWALWVLGPQVERGVGTWPFVSLYLAAAGMGGVAAYYFGGPFDVGVGASGAIFGLFGIWISWAIHRRNTAYGRAVLNQLGFLLLINAAMPFIFPGISWQAHLGGLITGYVIGEIWARVQGPNATAIRTTVGFAVVALAAVLVSI
jgi:membrane associated rhomboid family serine protease